MRTTLHQAQKTAGYGSKRALEHGKKATEAAAFNYHGTLAFCGLRRSNAAGHCIRRGLIKGDVASARAAQTHFSLPEESLRSGAGRLSKYQPRQMQNPDLSRQNTAHITTQSM